MMIQAWMGTEVYRGSHLAIGHRQIAFSISWSSDATLESNRTATASMLPLKFIIGKVYLVINLLLCGGVQQKHKITLKVYNWTSFILSVGKEKTSSSMLCICTGL